MVGSRSGVVDEILGTGVGVKAVSRPVHCAEHKTRSGAEPVSRRQDIIEPNGRRCGRGAPGPVLAAERGRLELDQHGPVAKRADSGKAGAFGIGFVFVQITAKDVRGRVCGRPRGNLAGEELGLILLGLTTGAITAALKVDVKNLQTVRAGQLQLKGVHPTE